MDNMDEATEYLPAEENARGKQEVKSAFPLHRIDYLWVQGAREHEDRPRAEGTSRTVK